ncbi:ion channel protein Tsx [Endozoicomonas sp. Mp262]|uniref:outer membrane protein OmpK n=1 Tax=Endozoicomonas sp. Mp262 TaxID=2919499 RepID=UPI0021DAC681
MGLLRNTTVVATILSAGFSSIASSDYQYGFGNVSINRLDWSNGTEHRSGKKDFTYLELEGGAGFSWGEIYGFADLENPHKKNEEEDGDGRRTALKGTIRYYLGNTGFNLYGHIYDTESHGFSEQNRLLGIGYNYQNDNLFFKPFLAANNTQSTFFSGSNGYVAGWVLGYNFKLADQDLMLTNWHEYEFNRSEDYSKNEDGSGEKNGVNGAVALWWNATNHITAGIQYRYADNKLGSNSYQNAMIYSLRYNF